MEIISLLGIGFLFGFKHAFDADHIAAVSVLAVHANNLQSALLRGILWGLGHALALLVIGVGIMVMSLRIPPQFSIFFEIIISILLIAFGISALFQKTTVHRHPPLGLHRHRASFFVGIIHGLAGSAAIFILFISAIQSLFLGIVYLLVFSLGSIVGMGLVTLAVSASARRFQKYTGLAAGVFSLVSGIILLFPHSFQKFGGFFFSS